MIPRYTREQIIGYGLGFLGLLPWTQDRDWDALARRFKENYGYDAQLMADVWQNLEVPDEEGATVEHFLWAMWRFHHLPDSLDGEHLQHVFRSGSSQQVTVETMLDWCDLFEYYVEREIGFDFLGVDFGDTDIIEVPHVASEPKLKKRKG